MVQGCETVQTSEYSVILGVPVALAGAVFFGLLFYLTVGLLRSSAPTLVLVFKVLAFLGALAIIPLFLLQAIVLKAFCSYCLATEVLMLAIWVLSFLLTAPGRSGEPLEAGAGAGLAPSGRDRPPAPAAYAGPRPQRHGARFPAADAARLRRPPSTDSGCSSTLGESRRRTERTATPIIAQGRRYS